jgi:transcriptional regulator with XRE-family HTH domain
MKDFGKRLKAARIMSRYETAKDFAERLDMNDTAYRKYERGASFPPLDRLALIVEITGASLDFLLLGKASDRGSKQR